ncbi:MAG: chromosomal replication initiator protein DnaA [Desulfobacterales bacterium]|nr:chromosomal replication initiator protein DnaA [Desulfobacterales bacterium]
MDTIWKDAQAALRKRIAAHSYRMWIEPLQLAGNGEGGWTITCPNAFSRKRVQEHFGPLIEAELKRLSGHSQGQVSYHVAGRSNGRKADAGAPVQLALPGESARPHNGRLLRRDFTFEHFVVGGNNDFAYSASLSLASRADSSQAALYLFSGTGLGKSHLSQAVGHHILARRPQERVYYMSAEDFSHEMVQAYATLDTLCESGKRIIFSSSCLPSDIPKLHDKLRSRFASSLISAIDPPDFRTRVRILKEKSRLFGCSVAEEVLGYLASELTEDVRMLESGLSGVVAKSSLLGMPIDRMLAESVVKQIVSQRKKITIDLIKQLVCKYYHVSSEELISRSRKQTLVRPRQMAIFLSRRYTDSPLQTIGKTFNRYHATALYSIQCIERGIKQDAAVRQQVEFFRQKLETVRD